jgi:hypothetical protein
VRAEYHSKKTLVTKECEVCGNAFVTTPGRQRCGDCQKFRYPKPPKPAIQKCCGCCGDLFWTKRNSQIYCSKKCGNVVYRRKQQRKVYIKQCASCGREFSTGYANKIICGDKNCRELNRTLKRRALEGTLEHKEKINIKERNKRKRAAIAFGILRELKIPI